MIQSDYNFAHVTTAQMYDMWKILTWVDIFSILEQFKFFLIKLCIHNMFVKWVCAQCLVTLKQNDGNLILLQAIKFCSSLFYPVSVTWKKYRLRDNQILLNELEF